MSKCHAFLTLVLPLVWSCAGCIAIVAYLFTAYVHDAAVPWTTVALVAYSASSGLWLSSLIRNNYHAHALMLDDPPLRRARYLRATFHLGVSTAYVLATASLLIKFAAQHRQVVDDFVWLFLTLACSSSWWSLAYLSRKHLKPSYEPAGFAL